MAVDDSTTFPPLEFRVRVPEQVLMRQVGDEMVMLDLAGEKYYGLDLVGARLMQIAEAGATLDEIADRLFEEFDAERGRIEADIRRIVAELIAAGLLAQDPAR